MSRERVRPQVRCGADGVAELVDTGLGEAPDYLALEPGSVQWVSWVSKGRDSQVRPQAEAPLGKSVQQLDAIFHALPRSMKWRSFYIHDLPLVMDLDVRGAPALSYSPQASRRGSVSASRA